MKKFEIGDKIIHIHPSHLHSLIYTVIPNTFNNGYLLKYNLKKFRILSTNNWYKIIEIK